MLTTYMTDDDRRTVDRGLGKLRAEGVVARLWALDHTLWGPYPPDILDRLGWLSIAKEMRPHLAELRALAAELRADGIDHALVVGMGGASLAAEMLAQVFGTQGHGAHGVRGRPDAIAVQVVDTTDPVELRALMDATPFDRTVLVLSMKRWALEGDAIFKALYLTLATQVGRDRVGRHVIALTDPDAWVVPFAHKHGFRRTIVNSPFVGGRYAALSYVGLLPAALLGLDLERLLDRADVARQRCAAEPEELDPFGSLLGVVLGELAARGRDKLTFLVPPELEGWLGWVEQLVAESLGKDGNGILPVVDELPVAPGNYGDDRLFVRVELEGAPSTGPTSEELFAARHPVVELRLTDRYDLGALCFLWEFAVAIAGQRLGVNPFDQPNVEAAKVRTAALLHGGQTTPRHEALDVTPAGVGPDDLSRLIAFLEATAPSGYVALLAFLPRQDGVRTSLAEVRSLLGASGGRATTLGFGPRYLHSTGQLHKGDAGDGRFLVFTADAVGDAASGDLNVPATLDDPRPRYGFTELQTAQANGDVMALRDGGRHVLRLQLRGEPAAALKALADQLRARLDGA